MKPLVDLEIAARSRDEVIAHVGLFPVAWVRGEYGILTHVYS